MRVGAHRGRLSAVCAAALLCAPLGGCIHWFHHKKKPPPAATAMADPGKHPFWRGSGAAAQRDADASLRQVLALSMETALTRIGKPGGFAHDPKIHVPLPSALRRARGEPTMLGPTDALSELEVSLNRAAEAAAPTTRPVVLDAIRRLEFFDAAGLVKAGDSAATRTLQRSLEPRLTTEMHETMQTALVRAGAMRALDRVAQSIGAAGAGGRERDELTAYALRRMLDGLFVAMGEEEAAIRADPLRSRSPLVARVFASP